MTTQQPDIQFQIETLSGQLVDMLMQEYGMTMEQAMDVLYNSRTFEKVENPKAGLYYQSAPYVMDMLNEEFMKN